MTHPLPKAAILGKPQREEEKSSFPFLCLLACLTSTSQHGILAHGAFHFFFFSLTPSRVTVTVSYKDGILRPKTFSTSLVYQDHSWVKPHNPKDILDILEGPGRL